MPQDMLGSQARMWDCMCYTDDPAVLVVGVKRAVLALKVLHRILKSSGLMVAKASKWQIGSGALARRLLLPCTWSHVGPAR